MNRPTDPLAAVAAGLDPGPFALVRRAGGDHLALFTGTVRTVDRLADLPLPEGGAGPRTLALVPYRQIAERGFACVDDGTPLEYLAIAEHRRIPLDEVVAALPDVPVRTRDATFDISDAEYADTVGRVLREEIGHGAGANFVIHRTLRATVQGPPLVAALAALRRLLLRERGAYWTFVVHTGRRILVGASPERHVSVDDGLVMMNPISGTFRHTGAAADRDALLRFLHDPKEVEELYMVLDEELKMMATVAEHGGQVVGPYLKEMAHLAHTEYLLAGRGTRDVREVLRETMFAPTVTGSPMENACRVIARHERTGRRYYAGVLALLGRDDEGRQTLDAPILIRTAELSPAGELRVPVGATLVRHSTAEGEVAETHAKAAGVLAAFGLGPEAPRPGAEAAPRLADDPEVRAALAARNAPLARFWLDQRTPGATALPGLAGRRALIVDGEDTFTGMLAHQLRALGLAVDRRDWHAAGPVDGYDLVVVGPGPGDPNDLAEPKMAALRALLARLLAAGRPTLAVCLGHQLLAGLLGLPLHRRDAPYQGVPRDIRLFGETRRVGFYSSFTARAAADRMATPYGPVQLSRDPADGAVHALRGAGFAGVQFHPESVLSRDGMVVLADLLGHLLDRPALTGHGSAARG
ncbi:MULTISPECIES: chorismate-binding protein [Micromonospora]|uniref:anthranilate synthase n=1 Tax=Micromonospora solifontis TaxID=2487138 RepID=A0ABX9WLH8_9ACTN|nr:MULTISPECIES: chorismate-binding protein [Micromonospora]NES14635.1 chorismate-binding protein [Micromonospora sp. PPF5-17B]NES35227.1 chorismate-binding protein [Micromonospora solifontis]NES58397.1 chorismate-binding protein [Micromonospora sp. PPF5-6]RNM00960.1 chorismate-binding protein [Micromonospora solifontis]